MRALHTDDAIVPLGNDHALSAPFGTYRTADGEIAITIANDALFVRFAEAIGRPEWPRDARFATDAKRALHRNELRTEIEAQLGTLTSEQALALLRRAGIPVGPILGVRATAPGRGRESTGTGGNPYFHRRARREALPARAALRLLARGVPALRGAAARRPARRGRAPVGGPSRCRLPRRRAAPLLFRHAATGSDQPPCERDRRARVGEHGDGRRRQRPRPRRRSEGERHRHGEGRRGRQRLGERAQLEPLRHRRLLRAGGARARPHRVVDDEHHQARRAALGSRTDARHEPDRHRVPRRA